MAVAAPPERPLTTTEAWGPERVPHLRAFPPSATEDLAEGAVSGMAGAFYGLPGVVVAIALIGVVGWIIDRIRALEEERDDWIDIAEARAALAEAETAGTIPWEEIKKEHGL